jgi:PIN domain nuclease of toxin-antitoxin system
MRALLDTHAFLWWVTDDAQLSPAARAIIEDADNELYLSAASAWEITIKVQSRRLPLPVSPVEFVPQHMHESGFRPMPVEITHALLVHDLPPLHRDPFDRLLIAQAQAEGVPIITADPLIRQYDVATLW